MESLQHASGAGTLIGLTRRNMLRLLGGAALAAALVAGETPVQAKPSEALYDRCAKACAHCEETCRACHTHCLAMGPQFTVSQRLSADCMDLCATAAKLSARRGPMAVAACRACLQACRACGAECGKYPDMAIMAACARSCAACASACQAMVTA